MKIQTHAMDVKVSKYIQHKGIEEVRIYDPLYRDVLQLFYGDFEKFLDFMPEDEIEELREVNHDALAFARTKDNTNTIFLNKDKGAILSTVVHEITHIVFSQFQHRVISPTRGSMECQEFFCYKIEFYLDQILKTRLARHFE